MVKEAKKEIQNLTPQQAKNEIEKGNIILIDIREADELKNGTIAGAVHAPRGMIEFYADDDARLYNEKEWKKKWNNIFCVLRCKKKIHT